MGLHTEIIEQAYERLHRTYGPQGWWPSDGPFETILGAILTQSTAWNNAEKALAALRTAHVLSPAALNELHEDELAQLVRASGYYRAKARRIKAFIRMLYLQYGGDVGALLSEKASTLRRRLMATYGIGPETADSIILYASHQAVFVIDGYTKRILSRLGVSPTTGTYDGWQELLERSLPADAQLFNEYHALIVRLGKEACRKTPLCERCPLQETCPTAGHGFRFQSNSHREVRI